MEAIMNSSELPVVLTADDQHLIERKLAELPEGSDGIGDMAVFLPRAGQVLVLFTLNGDIASWCLMPATDQDHARALAARMTEVHRHELVITRLYVKAFADAAIDRASKAARDSEALLAARQRHGDTYPGEWDRGGA
jgi:hypothetical protein